MKSIRIILITIFSMGPTIIYCHELQVLIDLRSPFVSIHSQYGENEFCSYADVSIFGPKSDTAEFQTGNADVYGNFSFLPDSPGIWKVKVDDGLGHVKSIKTEVTDSFFSVQQKEIDSSAASVKTDHPGKKIPVYLKAVFGLSLIFGITGIFYWFKANKLIKDREKLIEA